MSGSFPWLCPDINSKTFIVPEVIYDPSLFLSPHVFLLAILFRRRAFLNDRLKNNPAILAQLKVRKEKQLPPPSEVGLGRPSHIRLRGSR